MKHKGYFICIEGLDKSGKTSQSILLVEALCRKGFDAVYTTEPSNGEIGRFIRKYVLHRKDRVSPIIEALLFAADRADHVENEIKPLLSEGKIIVSDRYVYSSLAYQGATGLSLDWIKEINKHVLQPDLSIYIDVSVETLMKRYGKEKSVMEQFETQKKVEKIYKNLVQEGKLIPVNGEQSIESAANEIFSIVLNYIII
ncbi:dTMP kinase [Candidatus Bathyarchaeota archaeon]|nr:dTMP kinase [Candidatus Bathyarchaeota archaeon]